MQGKTHKAIGACVGVGMLAYDLQHGASILSISSVPLVTIGCAITAKGMNKGNRVDKSLVGMGIAVLILAAISVVAAISQGSVMWGLGLMSAPLGAMLPDIDHDSSKLGRTRKDVFEKLKVVLIALAILFSALTIFNAVLQHTIMQCLVFIICFWGLLLGLFFISKNKKVQQWSGFYKKHRGIMHTLFVPILIAVLAYVVKDDAFIMPLLVGVTLGYVSHLVADTCTVAGCPLLWPVTRKCISILPIRTGTTSEYICAAALGGLFIWIGAIM